MNWMNVVWKNRYIDDDSHQLFLQNIKKYQEFVYKKQNKLRLKKLNSL